MEGKTISGYTIKKRLGIGGMAEVWYAENKIGKNAAVKVLLPELCRNTNIVERFVTEAKTMVMLNHPNIRQVYDYGDIDGCPAIVMEYLDGDDLKAKMKQGMRFTDEELIKWWNQLVDALKYTHSKGVVHRDIKPGNIFVDKEGNIKLLDFGIAKVRESITSTQTGQKLGTLMYMSPEQVRDSKHIDYHTDIYSLAVTFVHLVTGRKPYDSDTYSDFDIQTSIVSKPLDMSEMPEKWQNFLAPYLNKEASKRPELRYFDENVEAPAETVEKDESTIVDTGEVPSSRSVNSENSKNSEPSAHSDRPKKKKNLILVVSGALTVVAAAVYLLFLTPGKPADNSLAISGKDSDNKSSSYEVVDDDYVEPVEEEPVENIDWLAVPKYDKHVGEVKVRKRNVMNVYLNSKGQVFVNDKSKEITALGDLVKDFITPAPNNSNMPEVEKKHIDLLGDFYINRGIVNLTVEDGADKRVRQEVISNIVLGFAQRRNEVTGYKFNKNCYNDLADGSEKQKAIQEAVPFRVVGVGDYSDMKIKVVDNSAKDDNVQIDNDLLERFLVCLGRGWATFDDIVKEFEKNNSKNIFNVTTKKTESVKEQPKPQTIQIVEDDVIVEDIFIHADTSSVVEYIIEDVEVEEEEEALKFVDEMPDFPGGYNKMMEYIQRNLQYPTLARESGIQGRVFVSCVIEKDGSVSNVRVLRGIGGGCDEEAIRVVKSLPKFKPGKQAGVPKRVEYTLNVVFQLK